MDQQAGCMKTHTLDLSDQADISLQNPLNDENKQTWLPFMSDKELKIRNELELDIERDLEQEIKDGIYHLALRLHRLYQHQKERNMRENSSESNPGNAKNIHKERTSKILLSEVNISIKLQGGTKIEIKETKKEMDDPDQAKGTPRASKPADYNVIKGMVNAKKFDWARSLRSSSAGQIMMNMNLENARRNLTSCAGQRKGIVDNRVLELGWKC